MAWAVYRRLTGPAVEKFGLQEAVFELMGLELDPRKAQRLIEQLDAIVDGLRAAGEELNRERQGKGAR